MGNPETKELSTREGQTKLGLAFRQVRQIMSEPYTQEEIEMLMWQTPIGDQPNQGSQLPAEEQQLQLEDNL